MIATRWQRIPAGRAGGLWRSFLLALAASAAPALAAGEPGASPRPAGKTVSVSLPAPTTRQIKPIAGRIELTQQEKTILADLQDRTDKFDEPALYVTFAVAARMPKLDPIEWEELDRPAYVNLLADPNRYRITPLRMKVKVHYVSKLQPGAGLNFSEFWPKDRPVWEIDCVQSDTPHRKDKPLRLYSIADPSEVIGEPDEIGPYRRWKYTRGREVRIAALFYKIFRSRSADGAMRDYPELIVWQLSPTFSSFSVGQWDTGKLSNLLPLLLLIAVLGAGFYFTRRRLARLKQDDARSPIRRRPEGEPPRRDAAPKQQEPRDEEPADGSVDPDLAAAAEEYLQQKADADDRDRPG